MASPKLLIGGVVTVGSVSTAAVVAHQQGFFPSFNNQTQSSDDTTNARTQNNTESEPNIPGPATTDPETLPTKSKKDEIKEWLETNKEITNLTIKITKGGNPKNFDEQDITENDLDKLPTYLTENTPLLKNLASGNNPTLTFEKTGNVWKYLLTKDLIDAWVSKTSGSKATLKFRNGNGDTTLESLSSEFEAVFKCLRENETLFSSLKENKTLIFEKDGSWKHIKQAIKDWLKSSEGGKEKLKVQIKKSVSTLYWDSSDFKDDELIGLLKHLKTHGASYITGNDQTTTVKLQKKKDSSSNEWEKMS